MKRTEVGKFGVVVAGLVLSGSLRAMAADIGVEAADRSTVTESALPKPGATLLPHTMRITIGKMVATLELPPSFSQVKGSPAPSARYSGRHIVVSNPGNTPGNKTLVASGSATLVIGSTGNEMALAADQITMRILNDNVASFSLLGKGTITVRQDGKQVLQISADEALLEPVGAK